MTLKNKIKTAFAFVFGLLVLSSSAMNSQDLAVQTASSCETMPLKSTKSEKIVNIKQDDWITLEYNLLDIYRNTYDFEEISVFLESYCKLYIDYNYSSQNYNNALLSFYYLDDSIENELQHSTSVQIDNIVNHNLSCLLVVNSGNINFSVRNDDLYNWTPVVNVQTNYTFGYYEYAGYLTWNTIVAESNNIKSVFDSGDFNSGYQTGFEEGIETGYQQGFESGQEAVNQQSYQTGYNKGYQDATDRYSDGSLSLNGVLTAIITAPATIIKEGLDFEILGFNVGSLVMSLIVIGLVVWAIGFFKKG